MKRILDPHPQTRPATARTLLGAALLLLGGIGLAASEVSVHALAADTRGGDLTPFVGTWKGVPNDQLVLKLEIRPDGTVLEHQYTFAFDGDTTRRPHLTQKTVPATHYEVHGRTLSYTTRFQVNDPHDSWPKGIVESESVLELQGEGEAVLSVQPNSFFKHLKAEGVGVPPPPPPLPMKRQP